MFTIVHIELRPLYGNGNNNFIGVLFPARNVFEYNRHDLLDGWNCRKMCLPRVVGCAWHIAMGVRIRWWVRIEIDRSREPLSDDP